MESKKEKIRLVLGLLLCSILCSITLFVSSQLFVNECVTPKWLFLMIFIGIVGVAVFTFDKKISFSIGLTDGILIICFFLIFLREWIMSDSINLYPFGLLLLYFLVRQAVTVYPLKYLYVIVFFFNYCSCDIWNFTIFWSFFF